jgi:hypothetical protein
VVTFECYTNVRAIYLPPGRSLDGGSCDFMTEECALNCGYKKNKLEELNLEVFRECSPLQLGLEIRKELKEYDCKILSWFATGDCPYDLTDKVYSIMDWLADEGFIQCGFTRNVELWERLLPLKDITLGLTVEDEEWAKRISKKGLVSVPDYNTWTVTLYKDTKPYFNCGGGFGTTCGENFVITKAEEIYPEDCGKCYERKRGCFV